MTDVNYLCQVAQELVVRVRDDEPAANGRWLENVTTSDERWALLFILTGTLLMFPDERIPHGSWLVGIGLILLTLNAVRLATGIPVRVLPTLLGALALAAGLGAYAGVTLPLFALTLVAIGASIVLEPLWAHRA